MFKLTTPKGQASLHLQQADQELTLEFFNGDSWKLHIVDTSGSTKEDAGSFSTVITLQECAALLFIWGNCDADCDELTRMYDILHDLLKKLPHNLRPIP